MTAASGHSAGEDLIMKTMETVRIISQQQIADGIWDMTLEAPGAAAEAEPGQFVNLYLPDASKILPRPISLCGIDAAAGTLRLVYRISGAGTAELARMRAGDTLRMMGPLGHGFPLEEAAGKEVALFGGGIGIPPMLETARVLSGSEGVIGRMGDGSYQTRATRVTSILGYRSETFLVPAFAAYGEVHIATEDGSTGTKGNVLDALREAGCTPEVIFACGPLPMLRALKAYAMDNRIPCWISMEERMACGIGACLGCVCRTTKTDAHSQVKNARVCKDGPVFRAEELDLG